MSSENMSTLGESVQLMLAHHLLEAAFDDTKHALAEHPQAGLGEQFAIASKHVAPHFDFYMSLPAAQSELLKVAASIYAELIDTDSSTVVKHSRAIRPTSVDKVKSELAKIFKTDTPESLAAALAKKKQQSREDVIAQTVEPEKYLGLLPKAIRAYLLHTLLSQRSIAPMSNLRESAIGAWERANSGNDEEIIAAAIARQKAFSIDDVAHEVYEFLKLATKPSILARIKSQIAEKVPEAEFMDFSLTLAELVRTLMKNSAAGEKMDFDSINTATNFEEPLRDMLQIVEDAVLSAMQEGSQKPVPNQAQEPPEPAAGPA